MLLVFAILMVPGMIYFAYQNRFTRPTLLWGWFSIGFAAIVSSAGGFFLAAAMKTYVHLSMFQPLICGLAGNRTAVQCSRLSTSFHISCERIGVVNEDDTFLGRLNPWNTFSAKDIHSKTALVMIACAIPSHLIFMSIIIAISGKTELFNWPFYAAYLVASLIEVGNIICTYCLWYCI